MEKLPRSFRERNRTTRDFRAMYDRLPVNIQANVRASCLLFDRNPTHPSFRSHVLQDRKAASHLPETVSISITMQYRALFVREGDQNVWYWIGSHAEYKRFTGSAK